MNKVLAFDSEIFKNVNAALNAAVFHPVPKFFLECEPEVTDEERKKFFGDVKVFVVAGISKGLMFDFKFGSYKGELKNK